MSKTEALVEHMSEEHVMAIPDDVRHLPPAQLEIVMAALHGDVHDVEREPVRVRGVG
jgi:hypothetical protein